MLSVRKQRLKHFLKHEVCVFLQQKTLSFVFPRSSILCVCLAPPVRANIVREWSYFTADSSYNLTCQVIIQILQIQDSEAITWHILALSAVMLQ